MHRQFFNRSLLISAALLAAALFPCRATGATTDGGAAASAPDPAPEKIVAVHFMPQESIGVEDRPGQGLAGRLANFPSADNEARGDYLPEFLNYYRRPLEAARRDIALAQGCGINTFDMLLGASSMRSQYTSVIRAYWKTALDNGHFKMAADLWLYHPPAKDLEGAKSTLSLLKEGYDGAWRRYQGRYVVLLMTDTLKPADLDTIFSGIGGRKAVFLVLYNPAGLREKNPELFAQADAFTDWPNVNYAQAKEAVEKGVTLAHEAAKPYWYPAMPSFTQSRPSAGANVRDKLGAVNYVLDWRRAIDANAPAVCLATWNDLTEDSAVMPETNHGYAFYDLTGLFARWYLDGKPPEIKKEQIFLFHHPEVVENMLLPEGRTQMGHLTPWQNKKTLPTDYVDVVTALKEPTHVSVILFYAGKKHVLEKDFGPGIHQWLIYHPAPQSVPESYPSPKDGTVDCLVLDQPFEDTNIYVDVSRNGSRLGFFRSHRSIVAAAGRGDLTTTGDAFDLDDAAATPEAEAPNAPETW